MELYNWTEEDLEDLDAKFDALIEYLGIEFVFERVSDGSDAADTSRCYARAKAISGIQNLAAQHIVPPVSPAKEPDSIRVPDPEYPEPTEEPMPEEKYEKLSKKKSKYDY